MVEKIEKLLFRIAPIPVLSAGNLIIQLPSAKKVNLHLMDVNGMVVKFEKFNSSHYGLNMEDIRAGIYFVRLLRGNKVETKKILFKNSLYSGSIYPME